MTTPTTSPSPSHQAHLSVLMFMVLISTKWVIAQSMHSSKEFRNISLPLGLDSHIMTTTSRPSVEPWVLVTSRNASVEQTVNALSAKMASFTALEQKVSTLTEDVSSLTARICKLKRCKRPVSSGSDSAKILGIFSGPGSSCDNRNTRRRLDTISSPEDEHARSAV